MAGSGQAKFEVTLYWQHDLVSIIMKSAAFGKCPLLRQGNYGKA